MDNPVRKFIRCAAGKQDGKFFDGFSDRKFFRDDHYSRRILAGFEAFVRMLGHRVDIVCDDDAILRGCPIQYLRIRSLEDFCLLRKQVVNRGQSPFQSSEDPVVEILIHEQLNHRVTSHTAFRGNQLRAAMAKTLAECCNLGAILDLATKLRAFLFAAAKVLVHGGLVLEVKGERTVDTAKRERREAILNLLGGSSLIELVNHRVDRNARVDQPDCAILVLKQRCTLRESNRIHQRKYNRFR